MYEVWDYFFADIDYQLLQMRDFSSLVPSLGSFYQSQDYLTSSQDYLANLDYFCIAIFQHYRDKLLKADLDQSLQILNSGDKELGDVQRLICIAERVKKVFLSKCQPQGLIQMPVSNSVGIPIDVNAEIEKFNKNQRLQKKTIFESNTEFAVPEEGPHQL